MTLPTFSAQRQTDSVTPFRDRRCDSQGAVIGFVRVEARGTDRGELVILGRHPRFRGTGLGPLLVSEGLRMLTGLGCAVWQLEVAAVNGAAKSLYERFGFRQTSEIPVWRLPLISRYSGAGLAP